MSALPGAPEPRSYKLKIVRNTSGMNYELTFYGLQPNSEDDKNYVANAIQDCKETMEQAHVTIPVFGKEK